MPSYTLKSTYLHPPFPPVPTLTNTHTKGDVLEWITWGGGGLGDPLTRPPETVAQEVHRKLVTTDGAARNYGVVVAASAPHAVDGKATTALRARLRKERDSALSSSSASSPGETKDLSYNRGAARIEDVVGNALRETGLEAPKPQWEVRPYGPHVGLAYVRGWYERMKREGWRGWDV